jgi:hypothetical protein
MAVFTSNYQKCPVFLIISYVFSSTYLENKKEEQVLPESGEIERGRSDMPQKCMCVHIKTKQNKKLIALLVRSKKICEICNYAMTRNLFCLMSQNEVIGFLIIIINCSSKN